MNAPLVYTTSALVTVTALMRFNVLLEYSCMQMSFASVQPKTVDLARLLAVALSTTAVSH